MELKRPHDSFFKKIMSNPENIKDFLANFLPYELKKVIDFNTIKIIDTEKSDRKYKRYYLDLSVECLLKNSKSQIYIVFEHKSYPDKLTMIQVLNYCSVIWENNIKNQESLIPIIPLIFYHGRRRFDLPLRLIEYFEGLPEQVKRYLLNFEVLLFDTNRIKDEELFSFSGNIYLIASLLGFKHVFDDIKKLKPVFKKLIQIDKESFLLILEYFVMSKDIEEKDLEEILKEVGGDDMPSLAERWYNQGIEQGMQQGIGHGLIEAIRLGLRVKFKKEGNRIANKIQEIKDIEKLKKIQEEIIKADNIKDIEKIFDELK